MRTRRTHCGGVWLIQLGSVLLHRCVQLFATSLLVTHTAYRVLLAGHVTGGTLKTPDKADKESVQAEWFPNDEKSFPPLRAPDIIKLIQLASKWYAGGSSVNRRLTAHTGHVSTTTRLIAVHVDNTR